MRRLAAGAIRLVWEASRKEFVTVLIMDVLQGLGIFVLVITVSQLAQGLITSDTGGDAPTLPSSVIFLIAANTLIVVAEAVIHNRRMLLTERTAVRSRQKILEVACLASLDDFDDSAYHDRLQRAASSSLTRPVRMVESMVTFGQAFFALVAVATALIFVQPWIALFLALTAIPIWMGGVRGGEQHFEFVAKTTSGDRSRHYLFELLTSRDAAKEIRAFNLEQHFSRTWHVSMNERLALLVTTLRKRFRSSMVASVGSGLILALAAGVLILVHQVGFMSLAETATAAGALLVFSQKLADAVRSTNEFFEAAPLVGDLEDFLELKPSLLRARPTQPAPGGFDQIVVDDVFFTYRDADQPALRGVSLTLEAGQVVALVGENGSGKTTLTKLLAGLYPADAGRILVDGTDIAGVDPASWRESVAVLFQDFFRYALTATENIHVGSIGREPTTAAIEEAARAAGADEFLSALPDGYRTMLSPQFGRGQDLSLGQWQRVALARAFFKAAPLVILDEPTASLDARAERALFDSVRDLYDGRTVLLISHRFSTVRTADRIIVLDAGRVLEEGTHEQLVAQGGLYAELFTIQAAGYAPTEPDGAGANGGDGLNSDEVTAVG